MNNNKTSYQYLQEFCKIKSRSSFDRKPDPKTPRVDYIIEQLKLLQVNFQEDEFLIYPNQDLKYINVYVKFQATDPLITETVLFVAHHDISNPNSENCQDNSASVCNLLEFCSILKQTELNKNIIICFTDGEEPASFNGGAGRIGKISQEKLTPFENISYAINLELTGNGTIIWMDTNMVLSQYKGTSKLVPILKEKLENTFDVGTPFSDSYTLRYYNIDSVCIGCFTPQDVEDYKSRIYPETWKICHSPLDTIDKISEKDMGLFVNEVLIKLI